MKIYWNEKGSCRGAGFRNKGSFDSETIKAILKEKDEDRRDELIEGIRSSFGFIMGEVVCCDSLVDDFKKILKKGKGYLCLEESVVGFGSSDQNAKLSMLDAIDNDDWGF